MENINKNISTRLNRGKCLWCGETTINQQNQGILSSKQFIQCSCHQYIPKNRETNSGVCECGHAEIWHDRNNPVKQRLKQDVEITKIVSPYINSLKHKINDLENRERLLVNKIRDQVRQSQQAQHQSDGYLCSVCINERRNTVFLPCKHAQFCKTCSEKWIAKNTSCPICRTKVECILDIII